MSLGTWTWRIVAAFIVLSNCDWSAGQTSNDEVVTNAQMRTGPTRASEDFSWSPRNRTGPLALAQVEEEDRPSTERYEESTVETTETKPLDLNYDLAGPYNLRSADPEEAGDVEIKNIFGWSTSKDGSDDDTEYEFEVEWGFMENHELIVALPMELGDGRVDGNADLEIGWHWRLWKEKDWLPAFGMRNFVRLPSGVDSSGVDYEWIGLITKSIIPGKLRFDANPFVKSVNGDNEEDARHFQWGGSFGLDWRLREDLILVGLYRYTNGEIEHTRDNHSLEFGGDWKFAEHQKLGFSTEIGLDGDSYGTSLGAKLSYMLSF